MNGMNGNRNGNGMELLIANTAQLMEYAKMQAIFKLVYQNWAQQVAAYTKRFVFFFSTRNST